MITNELMIAMASERLREMAALRRVAQARQARSELPRRAPFPPGGGPLPPASHATRFSKTASAT